MRIRREESEERKRRERNAQVSKRGFCRMYLGGDQMIVYASEKERCCSTNKDIARERERHGDAQTRLHLHRLAPTVESEIPIAAIAVTNIPRVGGTKVFVACVWLCGGGGATSTRRRTFHGSQRITRNLDESLASCDELEGSDATMSIAQFHFEFIVKKMLFSSFVKMMSSERPINQCGSKQFSVGDRSMARQTAVAGICSQYIPSRRRFEAIHSLPDPTLQIRSWKALRLFRDEGQTSFVIDDDDEGEKTGRRKRSRKSTKKS
ncbi:hypothetical protein ALC53_02279 [Atta colombica]|uniref:Uncharacterized protein n=1 Tax=Atta colombica TaxID=520822 RepID=A0A195BSF7_9HYME|nr:hypothetical protein ALC53_02279 [Atta colombica]